MDNKLENKLVEKYPEIFDDVHEGRGPKETLMCFGIACGDGWYDILDDLCNQIMQLTDNVKAIQIKEKYGTLRFYRSVRDRGRDIPSGILPMVDLLIRKAEVKSAYTCESCGEPGNLRSKGGWYFTSCDDCIEDENVKTINSDGNETTTKKSNPAGQDTLLTIRSYIIDFEGMHRGTMESIYLAKWGMTGMRGSRLTQFIEGIDSICGTLNKPIDRVLSKLQSWAARLRFKGVDKIKYNDQTMWQKFWGKAGKVLSKIQFRWNPLAQSFGCKFRDYLKVHRSTDQTDLGEITRVEYEFDRQLFGIEV